MSFLDIFSGGVSKVIDSIGNAVDRNTTSDQERLVLKNELTEIVQGFKESQMQHVENLEQQITDRHENDMKSDSWLSKNIRPTVLAFLTAATVVFMYTTTFMSLDASQLTALEAWLPLLQTLLITSYTFYFGGRSIEKLKGFGSKK